MIDLFKKYSFGGIIALLYYKIRTLIIFPNAKLIRFPIKIRGKKFIEINHGFVTGFYCRIDAFPIVPGNCLKIGKNVQINDFVHIAASKNVTIGDNVLIASKVFITDHNHGSYSGDYQDSPNLEPDKRTIKSDEVIIEKNVWIGEFVVVLPGVRIGQGSIIGSMSVVNKNIPPYTIAVGSPAKVIKKYNFKNEIWEKI